MGKGAKVSFIAIIVIVVITSLLGVRRVLVKYQGKTQQEIPVPEVFKWKIWSNSETGIMPGKILATSFHWNYPSRSLSVAYVYFDSDDNTVYLLIYGEEGSIKISYAVTVRQGKAVVVASPFYDGRRMLTINLSSIKETGEACFSITVSQRKAK